jgi:hypothetical protein
MQIYLVLKTTMNYAKLFSSFENVTLFPMQIYLVLKITAMNHAKLFSSFEYAAVFSMQIYLVLKTTTMNHAKLFSLFEYVSVCSMQLYLVPTQRNELIFCIQICPVSLHGLYKVNVICVFSHAASPKPLNGFRDIVSSFI